MRSRLIFLIAALIGVASTARVWKPEQHAKFQEWKRQFNKNYASHEEETKAKDNMLQNHVVIEAHNKRFRAGKETFERSLWNRSDMSFEEKKRFLTGVKHSQSQSNSSYLQATKAKAAPATLNWVSAGLVNAVDDQQYCGACYAFATVGVLEGILRKKNITTRLSVQQIIDCSKANDGCAGGDPLLSLKYAKAKGLTSSSNYPYTSKNGKCQTNPTVSQVSNNYRQNLNGNEIKLKEFVANYGPVAVAIDAADSLMSYKTGVYNNPRCSKQQDHAVLLVGYGTDSKYGDYWLVKNSWGDTWGEKGYVRMARNKKNQCGIANSVWYAT